MLTPLYLNFENSFSPVPPQAPVPINPIDLDTLTDPVLGTTFYYLVIYPPQVNVFHNSIPFKSRKLNIPSDPKLKNKLRFRLPPSIGHGLSSCYRVEYWEWAKPYVPTAVQDKKYKVKHTQIGEEYWYIPTVDRINLLNYEDLKYYDSSARCPSRKITLTRGPGLEDSLLQHLDVIDIVKVIQGITEFSGYQIIDSSIPSRILDFPPEGNVVLDWRASQVKPLEGTQYDVFYFDPLTKEEILWQDRKYEKTVIEPSYYSLPYHTPFSFY